VIGRGPVRRGLCFAGTLAAVALSLPASASATPTCSLDTGTGKLTVTDSSPEQIAFDYYMDQIWITGDNVLVNATCDGGTPTMSNVDSVVVNDLSDHEGRSMVFFFNPSQFSGMEWKVKMDEGGRDLLSLQGADSAASSWLYGSRGINLDPAGPADVDMKLSGVEVLFAQGGTATGAVDFRAGGGSGTGSPTNLPFKIQGPQNYGLVGGPEGDRLEGGSGNDEIDGQPGPDRLLGGAGRDRIKANDGEEDVRIDCGPGNDRVKVDALDPNPRHCEEVVEL
jgi:hypothetical protein